MSAGSYEELRKHVGHNVEIVCYGRFGEAPENVAIECEDCNEVLLDFDREVAKR